MPDDESERSPSDGSLYRTVAPSLDRRNFLKTTAAGALVTGGVPSSVLAQERMFTISQPGGTSHEVTALTGSEPIEEFYGGSSQFTSTRLERNETSHLFLYDGPNGLSLVVIHDAPTDGEDGAVSFDFTGLPTSVGQWVVQDESGEFDSATDTSIDWRWPAYPHKDGGAWRGGLDTAFTITIDPLFNGDARRGPQYNEIKRWQFLSGDVSDPDRLDLDMNAPVTITSGAAEGTPAFDAVRDQKLALAGQIDTLARDIQETPRVDATLGELGALVDDGRLDEGTAVAAVQRMKLGENVTEELLADFGPEVLGDVDDGSPDDLIGNPAGATEYNTAGSIVQAGMNILIETILTFFPFDKVVDYLPSSITSKIDTAKSKLSKFIDYAVDTILGGSGDFARQVKRNSDDVAQTLLEFIRDEVLGTGAELASQQSTEVSGFKDTLADLLVAIYEDDIGGTTIDDKLRELDDAFTPTGGSLDLDGTESGARSASTQGISDVKGRLEHARGVVNAIQDALNKIGWLGLIAGCLVATGFFAVAGKTLDLALLVVNIAGNLFGVGTSALAMIDAVDDHNAALDGVISGGL